MPEEVGWGSIPIRRLRSWTLACRGWGIFDSTAGVRGVTDNVTIFPIYPSTFETMPFATIFAIFRRKGLVRNRS
jgi:hypothetical protein